MSGFVTPIFFLLLAWMVFGIRVIKQYERGVVFRLGKVQTNVKQPGLRLLIPIIDQIYHAHDYSANRSTKDYYKR